MERCSRFVEARAGLHFPRERWADLERALHAVAPDLGFADDAEACAEQVISERASGEEIETLISRLTIGETYFFRDKSSFEALELRVLPELIRARRSAGKRLRIWSAGCCTGEEPYSIAIAVSRALPDFADWEITILGTDINPRFLRKAEAGIYTQWSFRGMADEVRALYFRRTPEGGFELTRRIKKLVTFECVNLVEDVYPALLSNTNAMDVIFCRNVVMYFSRERGKKVVGNLHRSLIEGGWFFPGGPEASRELFGQFATAEAAGTILYRKLTPPASPPPPVVLPEAAEWLASAVEPSQPSAPPPLVATVATPAAPPADRARQLANEGRFSEALATCDEALAIDKLAPTPHYLRGLILEEQGAHEAAALALRRALYLDPAFVLAHFALGNLMRRNGRARDALRCFKNVRKLLRDFDPGAALPESEGLTAGRLLATLEIEEGTA